MRPIAESRLRASLQWELVVLERLSPAERLLLGGSVPPDTYGILRPRLAGRRIKSVGTDTALLFLTLAEPMSLPAYVRAAFAEDTDNALTELIADGIVEIEQDGRWESGVAALRPAQAEPAAPEDLAGKSMTGDRSLQALRIAAELPTEDALEIASFLYRYGTTPISPLRARSWSDPEAIQTELGLDKFPRPLTLSGDSAWWIFPGSAAPSGLPQPKLYLGVAVPALHTAISRLRLLVSESEGEVPAFKIGASAQGLHRPDRIVFYPASEPALRAWVARLSAVISDLPADPVPFSASLEPGHRISRGVDPRHHGGAWWNDDGSWRSSVTTTLAQAIVAARHAGETEPWRFALTRAQLAGINPVNWEPQP